MIPTLDELRKAKADLLAKSQPLRAQKEELQNQINPLLEQMRKLDDQIHQIERPTLHELDVILKPLEQKEAMAKRLEAKSA